MTRHSLRQVTVLVAVVSCLGVAGCGESVAPPPCIPLDSAVQGFPIGRGQTVCIVVVVPR